MKIHRVLCLLAYVALSALLPPDCHAQRVDDQITLAADDWPWWRGPQRNGQANPDQNPPLEWSDSKNVAWKSTVPGRGHSSPTVVGQRVLLATADDTAETQSVVCFDRQTGRQLWQTAVHRGGLMQKNAKSSAASSTVASDGERAFINFANRDAVVVTALDLDGKQLWQTRLCDYRIHQGYGASPAIYRNLVIVAADSHAGGAVAGLDRRTGAVVWRHDRPEEPNYPSPIILNIHGRDQLLMTGCNQILSLNPLDGTTLWETKGGTTECVTSTVTDGLRVFSSGGYPKNHLAAVLADGSGKIVWETKDRVYVPSLVTASGHLFGVLDAGVAVCWQSDTGQERWKKRLGGEFSPSPVLVGDAIYAANDSGETFVFRADSNKFEQLAANKLGEQAMSSPTICGGRIYLRVAEQVAGQRQETLYCLARE